MKNFVLILSLSTLNISYAGDILRTSSDQRINDFVDAITDNNDLVLMQQVKFEKRYKDGDISEIVFTNIKTIHEFLEELVSRPPYACELMHSIAHEIKKASFKHFRLEFTPSKEGIKLVFKNTSPVFSNNTIESAYNCPNDFEFASYLNGQSPVFKSSPLTLSFSSLGGNMLVIPKGEYTNFYDFASRATKDEISDFFKHVQDLANEFKAQEFILASHAGDNAGQTVFHFHLRFEFTDKEFKKNIKDKQLKKN